MADPNDLCTLSDLQDWLTGISPGPETTKVLPRLITGASYMMLGLMNRTTLNATSYTERRNGNGNSSMALKQTPILSVASLTIDTASIPQSPDGLQYGFMFDDIMLYLIGGNTCGYGYDLGWPVGWPMTGLFRKAWQNVVVEYSAGYATVPSDVRQACIELVVQKYGRRQHPDQVSQNLGGQVITFSQKDVPAEVQTTCERYKYRAPIL